MQETDFPYELVIGEDCSTDNTRKICEDYAKRFPDKIRLLEREKNLGITPNFISTLEACRGEYIALCEGDDFWNTPNKLFMQVSALESDNSYSACATSATRFFEISGRVEEEVSYKDKPEVFTVDLEMLFNDFFIYTATFVFRASCLNVKDFEGLCFGDRFLVLRAGLSGDIRFINVPTTVYRIHKGGAMSTLIPANPSRYFSDYVTFFTRIEDEVPTQLRPMFGKQLKRFQALASLSNTSRSFLRRIPSAMRYIISPGGTPRAEAVRNTFLFLFPQVRRIKAAISG